MLEREIAFINHYCGASNCNATDAARRAGYSDARNEGYRLKRREDVATAIAERFAEAAMPPEECLRRLAEQARGIGAYLRIGRGGTVRVDMTALLNDGLGHLVKGRKKTRYGEEIEFYDAQTALVQIAKHLKLFGEESGLNLYVILNALPVEFRDNVRAALTQLVRDGNDPATTGRN